MGIGCTHTYTEDTLNVDIVGMQFVVILFEFLDL